MDAMVRMIQYIKVAGTLKQNFWSNVENLYNTAEVQSKADMMVQCYVEQALVF